MTIAEIPDYNLFMRCEKLNQNAMTDLCSEYSFRNCRPDELEIWKAFPFDSDTVPTEYQDFMNQIIKDSYSRDMNLFYKNTFFICDPNDKPIATCSHWKAYNKFNSIHWFKTLQSYEGRGLGRAILSKIMSLFTHQDYPIYLHTQPASFRAIKLYADFGFQLLQGGTSGTRSNDLEKCLPILKTFMPPKDFECLKIVETPNYFIQLLENETTIQF